MVSMLLLMMMVVWCGGHGVGVCDGYDEYNDHDEDEDDVKCIRGCR